MIIFVLTFAVASLFALTLTGSIASATRRRSYLPVVNTTLDKTNVAKDPSGESKSCPIVAAFYGRG